MSSLKRTGTSSYSGMLVARARPQGWAADTFLLRFVEESGVSTLFSITGEAIASFQECQLKRIYDFTVGGRCVRSSSASKRYGIANVVEVAMKFKITVTLSARAWSLKFPYVFIDWSFLDQHPAGMFFDIIGVVQRKPVL
jgi:hypothetical protein